MTPVDLNQVVVPTTTYEECGDATDISSAIQYDACTNTGGTDDGGGIIIPPPPPPPPPPPHDTEPFTIEITPT